MEERAEGSIPDTVLFVEHPWVITLGRKTPEVRSGEANLPQEISGVPMHVVERGGEATLHGPGQLVAYPILRLNGTFGPKALLRALENALVATLANFGVESYWIEGKTGIWLKDSTGRERKIASLGVAVRKSVSYHGLALNVSTDLTKFRLISPCGFQPEVMTNLEEILGRPVAMEEVKHSLQKNFSSLEALLAATETSASL